VENILQVKSLEFNYGKKNILRSIDLTCITGEILGIFGRNGSGKSTLLEIIFGTLTPKSGNLFLNNILVDKKTRLNKTIAYLHQDIFLPQDISIRNLVPLYFPKGDDQNRIFYDPLIAKLEQQKIGTLSLGEQKYFQFLLLINLNRDFVLLDEPFTMVEPLYRDAIKRKIIENKTQKGFIVTDHYYLDVISIATRKMVIKEGFIVQISSAQELNDLGYLPKKIV
jgi:ABC-type multidrug transport system ATPase subunit